MKNKISAIAVIAALITITPSLAHAVTGWDVRITQRAPDNSINLLRDLPLPLASSTAILGLDGSTSIPEYLGLGTNISYDGDNLHVGNLATTTMPELSSLMAGKSNVGHGHAISDVTGLQAALDSKLNTASTSSQTFATSTRSIVTGTGATGHQISSTRAAFVSYSVGIVTTATIGGNSAGYITLEVAPTNSATASDWYEIGARCRNDQTVSLAIILQSVQHIGCNLSAMIPPGYYAKLRSVTVGGTPTYSFISGQEVAF